MADLLFDCTNGVSGDMIVGALLDVGADKETLKKAIDSLNLTDFDIKISKTLKRNIPATDFDVELKVKNFDADLEYLYGNKKVEILNKSERNLPEIVKIIDHADMTDHAKSIAKAIFKMVAQAEGKAHNLPVDKVIFHESGAMDSIIDIVSIAVCFDNLNVSNVFVENLREGKGQIRTRVGLLPIPTPAVENVLSMFNAKIETCDLNVELITPTGISALAVLSNFKSLGYIKKVLRTGYGAGKRNYDTPCVLKVEIIEKGE